MVGNANLFNRRDPFFQGAKPHTNGYLESLHRTYGEPPTALPSRGEELYKRALDFREREKAHYATVTREHETTHAENAHLRKTNDALMGELTQIRKLWEQLSKVDVKNGDERVRDNQPAEAGPRDDRTGDPVRLPDAGSGSGAEGGGSVPVEVLRPEGDVRGHAAEHAAKGSEPRSGPVDTPAAALGDGGERKDKE